MKHRHALLCKSLIAFTFVALLAGCQTASLLPDSLQSKPANSFAVSKKIERDMHLQHSTWAKLISTITFRDCKIELEPWGLSADVGREMLSETFTKVKIVPALNTIDSGDLGIIFATAKYKPSGSCSGPICTMTVAASVNMKLYLGRTKLHEETLDYTDSEEGRVPSCDDKRQLFESVSKSVLAQAAKVLQKKLIADYGG